MYVFLPADSCVIYALFSVHRGGLSSRGLKSYGQAFGSAFGGGRCAPICEPPIGEGLPPYKGGGISLVMPAVDREGTESGAMLEGEYIDIPSGRLFGGKG